MNQKDILDTDKIFNLLLKLSIPTMIGGIFSALYNTVDYIFIGRYVGVNALAALTVSHSIQLIFLAFAALFGVGSGVLISKALGAKEYHNIKKIIVTASYSIFVLTFSTSLLVIFFLKYILRGMGVQEDVVPDAMVYISIVVFFAFVVILNGVYSGMLRAKGHSNLAMNLAVLGAILNIILDIIFIVIIPWGVFGAAVATVIAQIIVLTVSIFYIKKIYLLNPFDTSYYSKDMSSFWQIIKIGFPSGIRLLMVALSIVLTNIVLAPYGIVAIATYGIVSRIISLAFMPVQGCNFGTQPIISYNYGAKNWERLNKAFKRSFLMMFVIGSLGTIAFTKAPLQFFTLFTTNEQIILLSQEALADMGRLFMLFGLYMLLSGFVQSVGYVKEALFLSFVRPILNIISLQILPHFFGLEGIWYTNPIIDGLSFLISLCVVYRVYHSIKNKWHKTKNVEPILEGDFGA